MSLLLRDELRIMLCADRLHAMRIGRRMTGRGMSSYVAARMTIASGPAGNGETIWAPAVRALEELLPAMEKMRVRASLILSNRFVRYAVIPGSDALSSLGEEQVYAQQCFKRVYGAAAASWDIRVDAGPPYLARMASAVDAPLLEALRSACARNGIPLKSIQPHLMTVYNACRTALRNRCGWFALLEPGFLCLARLHNARWSSVRMMRVGRDWRAALPRILEREAFLADGEATTDSLYLWLPDALAAEGYSLEGWHLIDLSKLIPPEHVFGEGRPAIPPERR